MTTAQSVFDYVSGLCIAFERGVPLETYVGEPISVTRGLPGEKVRQAEIIHWAVASVLSTPDVEQMPEPVLHDTCAWALAREINNS